MISDATRSKLSSTLTKVRADEPAVATLQELPGIGRVLARRIVDHYGPDTALDVVREDPYRLIRDVSGIGFDKADAIALAGGLPHDSDARVEAGVVHAIDLLCREHCYTSRSDLARQAVKLLGVDASLVVAALPRLIEQNRIVLENEAVYTWTMHHAEEQVAAMLRAILSTPAREPKHAHLTLFNRTRPTLEEAAEQAIAKCSFTLAEAQSAAVHAVADAKVLVITGGPGTGKTTVLRTICQAFRIAGLHAYLAAPTGKAAKRMTESTGCSAFTIHRLLGLRPGKRPMFDRTKPLPGDVLVLDETSMVSLPLMKKVLEACSPSMRVILIGDVDQLPSIDAGAVLRDVIESGVVPIARLSQVFRQAAGSKINVSAQQINAGIKPDSDRTADGEFYVIPSSDPKATADIIVDMVTSRIPSRFGLDPANDVQVLCPTKKGADGVESLNLRIQAVLNPEGPMLFGFRAGDKVSHVDKNDYENGVMNGDVGFVEAIGPKTITVRFDEDHFVEYDKDSIQYLKLAYALTIHKSQGGEYKAVVMPMLGPDIMLSRNLLYTGVTRGKRVVVLVSNDQALTTALAETKRHRRNTKLAERLRSAA